MIATTAGALALLTSAQNWQRSTQVIGGGNDWRCRLFSNNVTVSDATILSNLTEAVATGYAFVQPSWATAALVGGIPTVASPLVSWTITGSLPYTTYGVYVTDALNSQLVGAANFMPTIVFTPTQGTYSTYISVQCTSQF